eukprot:6697310-Pyramimonas_sp.AAC.1
MDDEDDPFDQLEDHDEVQGGWPAIVREDDQPEPTQPKTQEVEPYSQAALENNHVGVPQASQPGELKQYGHPMHAKTNG